MSLILFNGLSAYLGSYYFQCNQYELLRNVFVSITLSLTTVFSYISGIQKRTFGFDNEEHPLRFWAVYMIGLGCTFVFALLPITGWLFLVFYICLAQVSDTITGIVSTSTLLCMTAFFCQGDGMNAFFLYLLCGICGILFFERLDDDFKIGLPLCLSVMSQMIFQLTMVFLTQNKRFVHEDAIIPLVNAIVTAIVISLYMQFFYTRVVCREEYVYQTLNDPEYEIMLSLKEESKASYYRSLHTAYLAERICNSLSLDVRAAKCAAYYHHFPLETLSEIDLPPHGKELIMQLKKKGLSPIEKEAVVVMICDTLITTIQYLSGQANQQKIQYETVIHKLFEKRLSPETFIDSDITLREMKYIEQKLIEEKMYYDFVC